MVGDHDNVNCRLYAPLLCNLRCWPAQNSCACLPHTRPPHLDIQHTVDGQADIILGDGSLVGHSNRRLLEAVRVRNAVHLAVRHAGSASAVWRRAAGSCGMCSMDGSSNTTWVATMHPSSSTHYGDEDVQPGRQRAAILAKPLHHISCRQGGSEHGIYSL